MIGKQVKGKSFRGVLNYLHDREQSRIIGGNMAGDTPRVMSAEFAVARRLNPQLEKAVYHSSLSLPFDEHLDDETWNAIASEYLTGMEFIGSQYVVYRHNDRDHDHIHIVASRIRITDGTTVSDSWDYVRSEQLIRELETKYELTPTVSSNQKLSRGQTSGEMKLIERTGNESVREKLQQIIDRETEKAIAMPELVNRLKDKGVDAKITVTRTGKIRGISYQLDGVATSGTHLGKAYTFGGLQKYKRVSYDDSKEREKLIKASERKPLSAAEIEPEKQLEINSQQTEQSQQYSEPNQTVKQKDELALALYQFAFKSVILIRYWTRMSDVRGIMPRVSRVLPHLSVEEVQQKIKNATNFRRQQKWLIVYNALVDPRTAAEIALHTGTTKRTVHQVISDYNRQGVEAIETEGKGGRRRGYLSLTEEKSS